MGNFQELKVWNKAKDLAVFFYIAKGSSAELLTQSIIAHEIAYLSDQHFDHIIKECQAISSMLPRLIEARSERKTV
jgi:four helix bundle protein